MGRLFFGFSRGSIPFCAIIERSSSYIAYRQPSQFLRASGCDGSSPILSTLAGASPPSSSVLYQASAQQSLSGEGSLIYPTQTRCVTQYVHCAQCAGPAILDPPKKRGSTITAQLARIGFVFLFLSLSQLTCCDGAGLKSEDATVITASRSQAVSAEYPRNRPPVLRPPSEKLA